jgi:U6 snRNA-associated Sm-like protein LSm8
MNDFVDKVVIVLTNDGRSIIGKLKGYDQAINVILEDSHERIYSTDSGVVQNPLGLYIIRGDTIAMISEMDVDKDAAIDLTVVRANPIKPVVH